jgi:hypothetical protein
MESRKAWRNREPSAGEGVLALLEALRDGAGAQAVGLFDDDRSDPGQTTPPNFWDAFDERPCADIDWSGWYGELRSQQRVETICGCGAAHHLCGFMIHDRWALLLVAPATLPSGAAAVIASTVRALSDRLPPGRERPAHELSDRPPADPAGGLLWWVRKPPHQA